MHTGKYGITKSDVEIAISLHNAQNCLGEQVGTATTICFLALLNLLP